MKIRALVQVHEKRRTSYNQGQESVIMHPVHAGSKIPEAETFSSATPSGEITLLMKQDVADHFELTKFYYVDFTPAEQ